jgi:hypothetical protein
METPAPTLDDGLSVGSPAASAGDVSVTAVGATSPGSGGCAAMNAIWAGTDGTATVTSGKGGDGAVYIYAMEVI